MTRLRTMCPMNCHPTLCGMLVDVEDGRLVSVQGDPENPDSRGFLCIRGQASREIIGNPASPAAPADPRAARRRVAPRHVGRGARPDRGAHAGGRARGRRHVVGARALRQQLRHPRGLAPAPPLRQPLRRAVVESHDDLLGAGRVRPRPHRDPRDQHQGGHGRPRQPHPPVGRQPGLAAEHRAPSGGGPPARRPRGHHRRARDRGGGAVRRDAAGAAGQRRRAGAGDAARDRRRAPRRSRVRRRAHGGVRCARRAPDDAHAGVGRGGDRRPRRADRRARPTLCHDAAGDDRAGRQQHAQGRRHLDRRARHRLSARAHRQRRHRRRRLRPAPRQRHARPGAHQHRPRRAAARPPGGSPTRCPASPRRCSTAACA